MGAQMGESPQAITNRDDKSPLDFMRLDKVEAMIANERRKVPTEARILFQSNPIFPNGYPQ
jgi:hypothetical protein